MTTTLATLPERIQSKIDYEVSGCWYWTAYISRDGYGKVMWNGEAATAHRVVYEILVGPITEETLDHLCRVRHCVNPDHLEPVSRRENILRGEGIGAKKARRTHCDNGHPLDGENVYIYPKSGARVCRCKQAEYRRQAKQRKENNATR